jgi:hypothetical protein
MNTARVAMSRDDPISAESRVESALRHLKEARSLTVDHAEGVAAVQK